MDWFTFGGRADHISADDRGAQYGDGLFETIAIRQGKARLWGRHLERLKLGCDQLGIPFPGAESLENLLARAIAQLGAAADRAIAKLVVVAPAAERGYQRVSAGPADVRLGVAAAASPPDFVRPVRATICSTPVAEQPALAGLKTLNRLEQVLARAEWSDIEIFEGLMTDTAGRLVCGTMSNVFARLDNQLLTPKLERCGVAGVMRGLLLDLFAENDMRCDVRDISLSDLDRADELFLSNSQFGVLPVAALDSRTFTSHIGYERSRELLSSAGVREEAE